VPVFGNTFLKRFTNPSFCSFLLVFYGQKCTERFQLTQTDHPSFCRGGVGTKSLPPRFPHRLFPGFFQLVESFCKAFPTWFGLSWPGLANHLFFFSGCTPLRRCIQCNPPPSDSISRFFDKPTPPGSSSSLAEVSALNLS